MVPQQRRRRRRVVAPRTAERRVIVARGPGGFGFTIAGQRPCVVSAVAEDGPADRAGLRAGDALLAVDGASVARAPHAAVARLVAGAPGPIALAVALREPPPTDTEDTEPDERARIRRRHPPPRRRPHPNLNHPGCVGPSTSGMSEILQSLSRAQLSPVHVARLECRAVLQYLGTIETPEASQSSAPGSVRAAVKKLRQERRTAAPVLLAVLPAALQLRTPDAQLLASYPRRRIVYVGSGSETDRRYLGLVTAAEGADAHSCHVFGVEARLSEHAAHAERAHDFRITCTRDPVTERCLEFPPSAEYVVGVIRGMYSLPPDEYRSPTLHQISKLVKGDSPSPGNFNRCSRPAFRPHRVYRHEEGQELVSNSPQPSNHSEITTTSSNSDSGIGFHNDCRNIADRIVVVDFNQQPPLNRFRPELPRRPLGIIGYDGESSFLSNPTPMVDDFGGLELPLDLDVLNSDLQPLRPVNDDSYNYNNTYANLPCVRSEEESEDTNTEANIHLYDVIPNEVDVDEVASSLSGVDAASVCSEGSRRAPRHPLQASLDDMLLSMRAHTAATATSDLPVSAGDEPSTDDHVFLHPATLKTKVRKSRPLGMVWKTRSLLGRRRRARTPPHPAPLPAAASEPDLRDNLGEQSSPFRRWTTSNGPGVIVSSDQAHRIVFAKSCAKTRQAASPAGSRPRRKYITEQDQAIAVTQLSKQKMSSAEMSSAKMSSAASNADSDNAAADLAYNISTSSVGKWSITFELLLADPYGVSAFSTFLKKEYAEENLRFWLACERYAKEEGEAERKILASRIWDTHLADSAPEPVNLDAAARNATQARLTEDPPPTDLFDKAAKHIFVTMKFDSYRRFTKSGIIADCFRASLHGKPLPYPPYQHPAEPDLAPKKVYPPDQHQPEPDLTPTKLNKSASNASERPRSSGTSLLPWRRRGQSRDRVDPIAAAAAPPAAADDLPPPACSLVRLVPRRPNDNDVLGGARAGRAVGLCRVVLPDGATSVVGVEQAQCVRDVVDRLLARRQLRTPAYDVVTTDELPRTTIDLLAPALVLAGREVAAEERAVVRFLVGGRGVGVRCAGSRRLRRVLAQLLELAPPLPPGARAVVAADNHWLHPDSCMRDLHSQWLAVHQVPGGSNQQRRTSPSPSDDSRYDVLIVTNEQQLDTDSRFEAIRARGTPERAQAHTSPRQCLVHPITSQSSNSSSSQSVCGDAHTARARTCGPICETGETDHISSQAELLAIAGHEVSAVAAARRGTCASLAAMTSVQATTPAPAGIPAARVRASLQPGAPLHQHPNEFLDSLRSTRRAILDKKFKHEETPPPPPPPLPPKPTRLPTFV